MATINRRSANHTGRWGIIEGGMPAAALAKAANIVGRPALVAAAAATPCGLQRRRVALKRPHPAASPTFQSHMRDLLSQPHPDGTLHYTDIEDACHKAAQEMTLHLPQHVQASRPSVNDEAKRLKREIDERLGVAQPPLFYDDHQLRKLVP